MISDKMREQFEAWASDNGMAMHLARGESGLYVSRVTQNYMDCWMASRAQMVAENEQLVAQARLAGVAAEMTVHKAVGLAATDSLLIAHERDQLKSEVEALRKALTAIHNEIECNTRCLIRDLVNRASGLNNDVHPNELYGDCDRIEAIIDAAMSKEADHEGVRS